MAKKKPAPAPVAPPVAEEDPRLPPAQMRRPGGPHHLDVLAAKKRAQHLIALLQADVDAIDRYEPPTPLMGRIERTFAAYLDKREGSIPWIDTVAIVEQAATGKLDDDMACKMAFSMWHMKHAVARDGARTATFDQWRAAVLAWRAGTHRWQRMADLLRALQLSPPAAASMASEYSRLRYGK